MGIRPHLICREKLVRGHERLGCKSLLVTMYLSLHIFWPSYGPGLVDVSRQFLTIISTFITYILHNKACKYTPKCPWATRKKSLVLLFWTSWILKMGPSRVIVTWEISIQTDNIEKLSHDLLWWPSNWLKINLELFIPFFVFCLVDEFTKNKNRLRDFL